MNTEFLIYLAGPIQGTTYEESTEWRNAVSVSLHPNVIPLSPMRWKRYLNDGKAIGDQKTTKRALSMDKGILARDRMDCKRADLILFNFLGASRASIGTSMEVAWGDAFGKPMVAVMDEGNIHDHCMVRAAVDFIVPTLPEAVALVHQILMPELDFTTSSYAAGQPYLGMGLPLATECTRIPNHGGPCNGYPTALCQGDVR